MPSDIALYDHRALRTLESHADGGELMRQAGEAAWRCLLSHWPQAQRIVAVCGPGNNGGDGYVLATHALQAGLNVRVVSLDGHRPRSDLSQQACAQFRAAGGVVETFDGGLPPADVIVDAIFGLGLSRAPDLPSAALIDAINAHSGAVLALDVPSGVDADNGNVPGAAVRAVRTLQMLAPHRGLFTGAALDYCGQLDCASLQVDLTAIAPSARALHAEALADWLRPRQRHSHKGNNGHVLCIGGDLGSGGAIALCCEAALRSGAGLVSVATRTAHVGAVLARRPEAMVHGVETAAGLDALLDRIDVVALGPGLGRTPWGETLFAAALQSGKSLVMDADALNLLALGEYKLPAETILTPHPGEAARLLGITAHQVQGDRFSAAQSLVQRFGCVVVLKGPGTIVCAPHYSPCVIAAGNPGMAVGGMGDALTGVIAGLRAQGFAALDAACCGALLHSAAGDIAARDGGERGLLPSDLIAQLRPLSNPEITQ